MSALELWLISTSISGKPDALLYHSDEGSQYTSLQFQQLMAESGIICMSSSGNV
jgi:putative transposase